MLESAEVSLFKASAWKHMDVRLDQDKAWLTLELNDMVSPC